MKNFSCIFVFLFFGLSAFAEEYSVIINKANDFSDSNSYRNYFLLKNSKGSYPNGIEVLPAIVKSTNSRVLESRNSFLKQVLGFNSEAQFEKYWIRQKSRGITRRPKEYSDFRKVLRYVEREAGAISYVPSLMVKSNDKIKVLSTFDVKKD